MTQPTLRLLPSVPAPTASSQVMFAHNSKHTATSYSPDPNSVPTDVSQFKPLWEKQMAPAHLLMPTSLRMWLPWGQPSNPGPPRAVPSPGARIKTGKKFHCQGATNWQTLSVALRKCYGSTASQKSLSLPWPLLSHMIPLLLNSDLPTGQPPSSSFKNSYHLASPLWSQFPNLFLQT